MPQSAVGMIGKFFQGYVDGRNQREAQKQQKVEGLMNLAKRYKDWAEDPNAEPELQKYAAQQMRDVIMEAEKVGNEKAAGLTALMNLGKKIFGRGGAPTGLAEGMPAPAEPPMAVKPSWSAPEPTATPQVATPGNLAPQPNGGGLGAPRPPMPVPNPSLRDSVATAPDLPASLPEARTPGLEMVPYGTPGSIGPKPAPMINGVPINAVMERNLAIEDYKARKALEHAKEQAVEVGKINQQFNRENKTWEQQQLEDQRKKQSESFANSEYGRRMQTEDPTRYQAVMNQLRYGLPYHEPTPMIREIKSIDDEGNRFSQQVDMRTNRPIGPKEPEAPTAYDQRVRSYILAGKAKNFKEAEAMFARETLNDEAVANAIRRVQLSNSQAMLKTRQDAERQRELLKNGKPMTPATAVSIMKSAISFAEDQVSSQGEDETKLVPWQRFYVEQLVGGKWEDLQRMAGIVPATTEEKANRAAQDVLGGRGTGPGAAQKTGGLIKY